MDRKKLPLFIGGAALLIIGLVAILNSGSDNSKNNVEVEKCCDEPVNVKVAISNVKIYLETSMSMKGYVRGIDGQRGAFPLKYLPNLITDLGAKADSLTLFTVTDKPVVYTKTKEEYYKALSNGEIFNGTQSMLQNSIVSVVDSLKKNEVALFISDCLIDLGSFTIEDLPLVNSKIYEHLKEVGNKNKRAVLFQYLSSFNGGNYYDLENNKSYRKSHKGKSFQYKDTLMANRPYYVWVFGSENNLKGIINNKSFNKHNPNVFSYGLDYSCCDVKSQLVSYDMSGKIFLDKTSNVIKFKDFDRDNNITFTMAVDLSHLPEFVNAKSFLSNNLRITPEYMNVATQVIEASNVNSSKVASELSINPTHYIVMTIPKSKDNEVARDDYSIEIKREEPKWVNTSHIDDDRGLTIKEIEGKTFGLNAITDAFKNTYENQEILLTIPFTIQKQ